MNIIDIIIIALVVISIIMGVYKGFLYSIINLGTFFLSTIISLLFSPIMASNVINGDLFTTIVNYTDGAQRIADVTMVHTPVASLTQAEIAAQVTQANFPSPVGSLLEKNLTQQAFADMGLTTMGQYFDRTVAIVVTNIVCFVIVYLIARVVFTVLLNGTKYVVQFPMLKQFDGLVGGCCGAVRGIFMMFVIFSLVPVVITMLPYDSITNLVESSVFGGFFYRYNLILPFIGGS